MEGSSLGPWIERVVHQGGDPVAPLPPLPLFAPERVVAPPLADVGSILTEGTKTFLVAQSRALTKAGGMDFSGKYREQKLG